VAEEAKGDSMSKDIVNKNEGRSKFELVGTYAVFQTGHRMDCQYVFLLRDTFEEGYRLVLVQTVGIHIVLVKAAERRRHLERPTLFWVCGDWLVVVNAAKLILG
jgi:hypothetical protein